MGAPLRFSLAQLLAPDGVRQIDRDYHIAMIAANSGEVVELHRRAVRQHVQQATQAAESNHKLGRISNQLHDIAGAMEHIDATLVSIAESVVEENRILRQIAETLARPYHTKARELRAAAEESLIAGMSTIGDEREAHWNDAMRLLRHTWKNPVGRNDPVVWFQLGWLFWVQRGDRERAERAFWHAQRLSASASDLYFLKSLRHLAYMKYLNGDIQAAHQLLKRAIEHTRDSETLFDAARYASRAGADAEAVGLLEQCIEQRPMLYASMCTEEDFNPQIVQQTSDTLIRNVRARLVKRIASLQETGAFVEDTLRSVAVPFTLQVSTLLATKAADEQVGYLQLSALLRSCTREIDSCYEHGVHELELLSRNLRDDGNALSWTSNAYRLGGQPSVHPATSYLGCATLFFLAGALSFAIDWNFRDAGYAIILAIICGYMPFRTFVRYAKSNAESKRNQVFAAARLASLQSKQKEVNAALQKLREKIRAAKQAQQNL